jgi:hypothetical protein
MIVNNVLKDSVFLVPIIKIHVFKLKNKIVDYLKIKNLLNVCNVIQNFILMKLEIAKELPQKLSIVIFIQLTEFAYNAKQVLFYLKIKSNVFQLILTWN